MITGHIDPRKIVDYALNPDHPVGRHKARVFKNVLGFDRTNAAGLIEQLTAGLTRYPAKEGKTDLFGSRFTVDILVTGPRGSGIVRTAWILKTGAVTPTLITLFVA